MAATQATTESRIEIVAERRRMHDPAFRARMLSLTMVPGASVHELARQHGLTPSLIYRWRRQALSQAAPPSGGALIAGAGRQVSGREAGYEKTARVDRD